MAFGTGTIRIFGSYSVLICLAEILKREGAAVDSDQGASMPVLVFVSIVCKAVRDIIENRFEKMDL